MSVSPTERLADLERTVQFGCYPQAWEVLLSILQSISIHRTQPDYFFIDHLSARERDYLSHRLVVCLSAMIMDARSGLSDEHYTTLAVYQPTIDALFYCSPTANADHLVERLMTDVDGNRMPELPGPTFNKLLLVLSLHSTVQLPLAALFKQYPAKMMLRGLSMINGLSYVDSNAERQRNAWMQAMIDLSDETQMPLSSALLSMVITAWMNCSYATFPHKNQIKRLFNRILKQWSAHIIGKNFNIDGIKSCNHSRKRPVVMVMAEYFNSTHAMYRCFGPAIASLKERFTTVVVTVANAVDETSAALFDEVVLLDESSGSHLLDMLGMIRDAADRWQPDILFYPSLGMQPWSILAAQWRLAPNQVMAMGHPASSYSDEMDYVVVEKDYVVNAELIAETLLETPPNVFVFHRREDTPAIDSARLPSGRFQADDPKRDVVDVAIPAFVMKLNARFIQALHRIECLSTKRVRFHFYPYVKGLALETVSTGLRLSFPDAVIHPPMSYADYLHNLIECDLYLSTFPFGNTNGNLDAALVGLPAVVLRDSSMDVSGDFEMFRRLGLPTDGLVDTEDLFVERTVMLIDDEVCRCRWRESLGKIDSARVFFSGESSSVSLADVYARLLRGDGTNHDDIVISDGAITEAK